MAEHFVTLVAEREGVQLGFVVVRIERDRLAELVAIAVVERERGRGVGSALLKAAEIRARAGGTPGITLHTAEANVAALELFTKRGFRVRRRLRRYYVGVFDACELVKKW
jgi:ribosomal protein S18 acetylase RimI-like enzyme